LQAEQQLKLSAHNSLNTVAPLLHVGALWKQIYPYIGYWLLAVGYWPFISIRYADIFSYIAPTLCCQNAVDTTLGTIRVDGLYCLYCLLMRIGLAEVGIRIITAKNRLLSECGRYNALVFDLEGAY
jgi:hypothetical protein